MCHAGICHGLPLPDQLFRAIQGSYLVNLVVDSEVYGLSPDSSAPDSDFTNVANVTFLVDMYATYNTISLGTDYVINATIADCAADSSSASLSLDTCPGSCALSLFNAADYTATFSQFEDGSFDHGSFQTSSGEGAQPPGTNCSSEEDSRLAQGQARSLLTLLAAQVETR